MCTITVTVKVQGFRRILILNRLQRAFPAHPPVVVATKINNRKVMVAGRHTLTADDARSIEQRFWVDVVATGRFEKIPESDCKKLVRESGMPNRYYPDYCFRIVIENVERVEPVPATVAWPQ